MIRPVNRYRPLLAAVALLAAAAAPIADPCEACGGRDETSWSAFEFQPKNGLI